MKRLVLKTTTSDHDGENWGDCELAVIKVDSELIASIDRRLWLAEELRKKDGDFYEAYFWDRTPRFYGVDLEQELEEFDPHLTRCLHDHSRVVMPDDFDLDSILFRNTELDRMVIRLSPQANHSVSWCATPKHYGLSVTCSIDISELRQLFKD
jgi:hypothetical protein